MNVEENEKISLVRFKNQIIEASYKREIEKERDLIMQSLQMQYAFSFIATVVFIVAQIACQYSSHLPHSVLFAIFSLISIPLIFCMVFATMAQMRMKHDESGDADIVVEYIDKNRHYLENEENQYQYMTKLHQQLQMSLSKNNYRRIQYLRVSQILFFTSIFFCFIGYLVYLIIEFP